MLLERTIFKFDAFILKKLKFYLNPFISLRNEFDIPSSPINSLHGASTPEQAKRELELFFPIEQTVALIKPGLTPDKKSSWLFIVKIIL